MAVAAVAPRAKTAPDLRPSSPMFHESARRPPIRRRPDPSLRRPALSAAEPDLAVLGRQRRGRALRHRPHPAGDAGVPALERRVPGAAAVRVQIHPRRLAEDPRQPADDGAARRDRHRRLQHHRLLRPAVHYGAERVADPVGRAAVRRVLVAGAVPYAADAGAGDRHPDLARWRARHHRARRFRSLADDRLQQGRPLLPARADDLLHLFGADAVPAADASAGVFGLRHRLRRAC